MKIPVFILFFLLLFNIPSGNCQQLQPGFDKEEYLELLKAYSRWGDTAFYEGIPASEKFRQVYRSPVMGLENRWELYTTNDRQAVISLRGTTASPTSWMANFYAAMVPASGTLQLSDSASFSYQLADDPDAAVHVGWLVSTAYLAPDIVSKLDSCYRSGTKDFIIFGHSQGGAIAYLVTSHLLHLQKTGIIPGDVRFKTYCSAGPKPGNLPYAYAYEKSRQGGWAFNVVNAADWVPETPISIQTVRDFTKINPFGNAKQSIRGQKLGKRIILGKLYRDLTKHTERAQRKYEKYLGKMASRFVRKHLPEFKSPEYFHSNHYVRTGNFIVLTPHDDYYKEFPDDPQKVFTHHALQAYIYLAGQLEGFPAAGKPAGKPAGKLDGKYGVKTISTGNEYREKAAGDSLQALVDLETFIPGIVLDIRYATANNFMEEQIYASAAAWLRLPAAKALKDVQEDLAKLGYGLKIFDAYRPYTATIKFYEKIQDSTFVASPWTGSRHNRGCAVDLTLISLESGRELSMPTGYDSFTEQAHTNYKNLPSEVIRNRELLKKVMTAHGFEIYPDEWWHYDFSEWKKYPLMDLSFEELKEGGN